MNLDEVLEKLEQEIARLADGSAPLEQLVAAHEQAARLVEQAQGQLQELERRLAEEPPK